MPKGVSNKRYTPEFKKLVVETMQKEKPSYREAARQFEINDHKCVAAWERIYRTEGPEGFSIERRGRGSKRRPPKQLPKETEEDLLAEVRRLRAENAPALTPSGNDSACAPTESECRIFAPYSFVSARQCRSPFRKNRSRYIQEKPNRKSASVPP